MKIALLSLLSIVSADAMTGEMTGFFSTAGGGDLNIISP